MRSSESFKNNSSGNDTVKTTFLYFPKYLITIKINPIRRAKTYI
jgi:hypothetical protein